MASFLSRFLLATCAFAYAFAFDGYTTVEGNCPGSPISELSVSSGDDCARHCSSNPGCVGFTLGNTVVNGGRMCLLKSESCVEPQASSDFTFHSKQTKNAFLPGYYDDPYGGWYGGAAAAPYYPGPAAPAMGGFGGFGGYYGNVPGYTRANGNCIGNFLSGVLALPVDQCAGQCASTPGCAGFSFNFHAPFPQCILKAASCPYPDPTAVFTYFVRNGFQGAYAPSYNYPGYYPPYYPDVYVPDYPGYAYQPWTKSARKFFKESSELCSGRILKNPEDLDLDKCADACLADAQCTGFSFDNLNKSPPYSCTLRAEACQSRTNSTRWLYFERQIDNKLAIDNEYLQAIDSQQRPEAAGAKRPENANSPAFFDLQKFFQRGNAQQAHQVVAGDVAKH